VWYEQGLRPDLRHYRRPLMTEGSDNLFSDLGFKEPELELAKIQACRGNGSRDRRTQVVTG
jgi:hypothetical protein